MERVRGTEDWVPVGESRGLWCLVCLYVRPSCLGSRVRCRENLARGGGARDGRRRGGEGVAESVHLDCMDCTSRRALCAAPGHTRVKAVNGTVRVCPLSRPPGVALGALGGRGRVAVACACLRACAAGL